MEVHVQHTAVSVGPEVTVDTVKLIFIVRIKLNKIKEIYLFLLFNRQ